MCAYFRNRFLIGSKRFKGFDYSSPGKYFITICTKDKMPCFGKIENRKMELSELGICLKNQWLETPHIRFDMNIVLDEFVIMPDHFHAIIIIGKNHYNQNPISSRCRNAMHGFSKDTTYYYKNDFGIQSKNLSSIIRGIKSAVTIYAKKNNIDFEWQPRFYDHIIRTQTELMRIRKYIVMNPEKIN